MSLSPDHRHRLPCVGLAAIGAWASRPAALPLRSAESRIGEFVEALQIRGEIKAGQSVTLAAPA